LLGVFEAELQKVLIYDMVNDVFYSELYIKKDDNVLIIDARTSDAVALAVRSDCPIYIKPDILNIVGTEVEPQVEEEVKKVNLPENNENLTDEDLDLLPLTALEEMLEMAINKEKYELAVTIRDAIKRHSDLK